MERLTEKSRLVIGAGIAIAIGELVRHVILHRNNNSYTAPQSGGWHDLDSEEIDSTWPDPSV